MRRAREHLHKTWATIRDAIVAIWETVQMPRSLAAIVILGYGLAVLMGFTRFFSPPVSNQLDQIARIIEAALLIYGGTIGMPSAWKGAQWLERSGAASVTGGLMLVAFDMATHVAGSGLTAPWVTILALLLASLGAFARYLRVKDDPYAPGCGPLRSTEQVALNDVMTAERIVSKRHTQD